MQDDWEAFVRETAGAMPFPPTPDIAAKVRARPPVRQTGVRQWAWAGVAALAVTVGLLAAVPGVRAGVLEALRIGAVRVLLAKPTPIPTEAPPLVPAGQAQAPVTATPASVTVPPEGPASILELAGETTLAAAQAGAGFPIQAPTYPPDLGAPDRVFLQELGGPIVVLVWLEQNSPDTAQMSVHQLGPGALVEKQAPVTVQETTVNGALAVWTEGPYLLVYESGPAPARLVTGHVLVWEENGITYRLETNLSLEEAVKVAESLEAINEEAGNE